MKKIYFLLLSLMVSTISFGQDLVLTGIFDGPLTGGTPKVIELYVINDIPDMSIYGLESGSNGVPLAGAEFTFPAEAKVAGTYIYVATESPNFLAYFGFAPTYVETSASNNNGDDAIVLYTNGAVSDSFGVVGTDGTGTPWESLDGWAYRNSDTGPDGATFVIANWTFSGVDATDGCTTTNGACTSVFPIGTYTTSLSVNENAIDNFRIFPNPTSVGYVNITSNNTSTISVNVFDVLGKQILNQTVKNNRLNVSSLKSGVYILKISQNNATITKKLVIK